MPFRFSLRFPPSSPRRWLPLLLTLLVVAIGIAAGNWQTRRAEQKQAIEISLAESARLPAPWWTPGELPAEFSKRKLRGQFLAEWPLYLDNRPLDGKAGFYVLMPLRLEHSDQVVLVLRGWLARNTMDRAQLPPLLTPTGVIELEGMLRKDAGHILQLGSAAPLVPAAIVQNVSGTEFASASKMQVLPFVLEQHSAVPDGLARTWPRPSLGIDKHRGYAFQWYGLALAAGLFFLFTGIRRG